jgi:endonuclease YncB( thermonuclease family)
MSSPYNCVIQGSFILKGKEPDGDSVRFIADNPNLYQNLHSSHRIKPSRDGSVQLRFEAVDAPELHYGSAAQHLGKEARDTLLEWMGFENVEYLSEGSNRVKSSEPETVRGAILSKAAEANGRPVSYVLLEKDANHLEDGDWVRVDDPLLRKTINYRQLDKGLVYYTVYTSTPFSHRKLLGKVASKARENRRGVWEFDTTSEFVLEDQASIGAEGQLILPKLFRRCTDYLKDMGKGFQGNLADWIVWISGGSRSENDRVVIQDSIEVTLSDLIEQRNRTIVFKADILDITFVEK